MKKTLLIIYISFLFLEVISQNKYIDYLNNNKNNSLEYLEKVFQKNDIVVFCEREHAETTQYDFYLEVIKSEWFIKNVGTIVCEVIKSNINEDLNSFIKSEGLTPEEVESELLTIYRNINDDILWTKTNLYSFIKEIYYLNQKLANSKKINIIGVDVVHDWNYIRTHEDYNAFKISEEMCYRDSIMANNLVEWYKKACNNERHKALVIMNYRHAFMNKYWKEGQVIQNKNFGVYIKHELPNKCTNVYLNSFAYTKVFSMRKRNAKGNWDKAFSFFNSIGINFKDSPFGEDKFQLYPYVRTEIKWKQVFDHMIYYNNIKDHIYSFGINNLVQKDFEEELKRRYNIAKIRVKKSTIVRCNTKRTNKYKLFIN